MHINNVQQYYEEYGIRRKCTIWRSAKKKQSQRLNFSNVPSSEERKEKPSRNSSHVHLDSRCTLHIAHNAQTWKKKWKKNYISFCWFDTILVCPWLMLEAIMFDFLFLVFIFHAALTTLVISFLERRFGSWQFSQIDGFMCTSYIAQPDTADT